MTKLTKRQARDLRKNERQSIQRDPFQINMITPLTPTQEQVFESYCEGLNLMVHGFAGTGKTFLLMYLALAEIKNPLSSYKQLKIIRSPVATHKIGFLPGDVNQKVSCFEAPYINICTELFNKPESYAAMKHKGIIDFDTTSFIRGSTFNDTIILVDEVQNLTWHEMFSVITRLGKNSKIMMCGDFMQSDLVGSTKADIHKLNHVCNELGVFEFIQMKEEDIVRSGICKDFIIKVNELGYGI